MTLVRVIRAAPTYDHPNQVWVAACQVCRDAIAWSPDHLAACRAAHDHGLAHATAWRTQDDATPAPAAPAAVSVNDRDFLEDVAWLADHGATWPLAAHRLGITPTALRERLRRAGRLDLAAHLRTNLRSAA